MLKNFIYKNAIGISKVLTKIFNPFVPKVSIKANCFILFDPGFEEGGFISIFFSPVFKFCLNHFGNTLLPIFSLHKYALSFK